jgi:transposase-like protein
MLDAEARNGQEIWGFKVAVNSRGTRLWPEDLKRAAVGKVANGAKTTEVANELGITVGLIHKWLKAAKDADSAIDFVELLPPTKTATKTAEMRPTANGCVIRLGQAELVVPPGFPADDLSGILQAMKAVL